jgi:hypothetical protein
LNKFPCGQFSAHPQLRQFIEVIGRPFGRPAHVDASRLRRLYAFGLPFLYGVAFAVRHEGQDLQYEVREESPHEVFSVACVQQRHINHGDIHTVLFGEDAPLALDFLIITPKPVNAFNIEQIAGLEFVP